MIEAKQTPAKFILYNGISQLYQIIQTTTARGWTWGQKRNGI